MRILKGLFGKVGDLLTGRRPLDEELLEELEEQLIQADLSVSTAMSLVEELRDAAKRDRITDAEGARELLQSLIAERMQAAPSPPSGGTTGGNSRSSLLTPHSSSGPIVYLFVGVNGTGKTTTVGKLAHRLQKQGHKVLFAAADTFRAAAIDQLQIWSERVGAPIVKQSPGSDPAAVVFDAIQSAKARGSQYVLIDTAGRLHNVVNLMEELRKIHRVIERELGRPADEIILVVDSTTGQNAISQARHFANVIPLTGIALTKLDGTAKGGIVVTVQEELGVPVKLAGVGEKLEDLEDFDPEAFAAGLFTSSLAADGAPSPLGRGLG